MAQKCTLAIFDDAKEKAVCATNKNPLEIPRDGKLTSAYLIHQVAEFTYLWNLMVLCMSIIANKTGIAAEHKCPKEWPLIRYRFALYIFLSRASSNLAKRQTPVARGVKI